MKGDFITAPEISQIFGEMIGAWLIDSWIKMGSPDPFILCECGPGRGTLMQDILRTAQKTMPFFIEASNIVLMEMSPVLIEQQKEILADYDVQWVHDVAMIPDHAPLILFGNEFLDALPARQFEFFDAAWHEKMVDINKNGTYHICRNNEKIDENLHFPAMLFPPQEGDHIEVSHEQISFLHEVINNLIKHKGIALFIDYGFTLPTYGDTLQAVKDHRYIGIFDTPGLCDMTTHVNFAFLGEEILKKNMTLFGPVSQAQFLKALGVETRAAQLLENASGQQREDIASAMTRLIGTDTKKHQMGDLFKVMAFTPDTKLKLEGYT
ncbi:MAG: SAM-dependent methyltransferase [Pseudomonadota bacterium]